MAKSQSEQTTKGLHPHRTRNALESNAKTTSIALLNARLADGIDLSLATKQAHWNLKGPQFIGIHLMLDGVPHGAGRVERHDGRTCGPARRYRAGHVPGGVSGHQAAALPDGHVRHRRTIWRR